MRIKTFFEEGHPVAMRIVDLRYDVLGDYNDSLPNVKGFLAFLSHDIDVGDYVCIPANDILLNEANDVIDHIVENGYVDLTVYGPCVLQISCEYEHTATEIPRFEE